MESMEEEQIKTDTNQTKKQSSTIFEMALLLVLGVLVGFSVKTEAAKKITMGSRDYLVSQKDASAYDINAIQKDLVAKGGSAGIASPQPQGSLCSQ